MTLSEETFSLADMVHDITIIIRPQAFRSYGLRHSRIHRKGYKPDSFFTQIMTDMKAISCFFIAAAAIACCLPARSQQTRLLTADKHNEYGLAYSLPVTSVRFEITARQTVSHAGPYYQYAQKYIGTDRVVKEDSEKWEIISVKAVPFGSADNDNRYLMQLKPGAVTSVCVADDGMLLSINRESPAPESFTPAADTE